MIFLNNGCIIIKLIQWLYTRYDIFYTEKISTTNNLLSHLKNVFEKCNIHEIDYTKQLFEEELSTPLYNIIKFDSSFNIKSGSIAQVYRGKLLKTNEEIAIKVTHPNLQEQNVISIFIFFSI